MFNYLPSKKAVRKLIENKGRNATTCEKVLGDLEGLYAIADFWERHAPQMELIATSELLDFIGQDNEFDSKDVTAFQKGLTAIPLFFQKCLTERQAIEKKKVTVPPPPMVGSVGDGQ